jgi:hypothetical protein
MFFMDPTYFWWVFIPTLVLSVGVQLWLKRTFAKWSMVGNSANMNGEEVADALFDRTSIDPIPIEHTKQPLGDHYDPKANVVRLSPPVYGKESVAAMAVSAHELGHVQQYQEESGLIKMRSVLLPAVTFSPMVCYACLLMGVLFNMTGLLWVGMLFFGLTVLFSLLTLPVEFDASKRGIRNLNEAKVIQSEQDQQGAKAVLRAAALTYVAAFVGSMLQFFYYFRAVASESQSQKARAARRQQATASSSRSNQRSSNKKRRR